uniref:Uncharacterized protein n=1 Tax=Anguilla anguilla TaxID=7936 RepID=A0A0E9W1Y9_ANGAN
MHNLTVQFQYPNINSNYTKLTSNVKRWRIQISCNR